MGTLKSAVIESHDHNEPAALFISDESLSPLYFPYYTPRSSTRVKFCYLTSLTLFVKKESQAVFSSSFFFHVPPR